MRRHRSARYVRDMGTLLSLFAALGGGSYYAARGVSGPVEPSPAVVTTTPATGGEGVDVATTGNCGKERWGVKTLTDSAAGSVDFTPKTASVTGLGQIKAPTWSPKLARQAEEDNVYTISARLTAFKLESDSDIHLAVADPADPSATMIVEFPDPACDVNAAAGPQAQMTAARNALIAACGQPGRSSFATLKGTATITGVFFFDKIHGQHGVAPNGAELHPALAFSGTCK
jgi:hypothetical protein